MHRKKIAGFSLTELMVVVGILGILATIAIPRYNSFIVQSRRAEAKSNLQQFAVLQEAYRAEHGGYYYSSSMGTKGVGYKDGLGVEGDCIDYPDADDKGLTNRLGFRPKACDELRYVYKLRTGGNTVIASAASDANKRHIYPDCDGAASCFECGYDKGDALRLEMSNATPVVCRNITKYCPDGADCTGGGGGSGTPSCSCYRTKTCGSVAPACIGQSSAKHCTETTVCVGHPSCVSSSSTNLPPELVPGTVVCNCDCPADPTGGWLDPSSDPTLVDPATKCTDTSQTQNASENITCPPPSTLTQACSFSRPVEGAKDCCISSPTLSMTNCCNGDDIDPHKIMIGGAGQEYCCPNDPATLAGSASCGGAGRKWKKAPTCDCECSAGLASSCTMGNGAPGSPGPFRKFNPMEKVSDGSVAHDACKCVCDDSQVNATECATRMGSNALPMVYEEATCSCVDAPDPTGDECADGRLVDDAEDECDMEPGHWKFSKGTKNSAGRWSCPCDEYCSDDVTSLAQARLGCDNASQVCGTDASNPYRFDRPSCYCGKPICKRKQCVVEAMKLLDDDHTTGGSLTSKGDMLAECYTPCSAATNKKICFENAVIAAKTRVGDADKLRELLSSGSYYTTTSNCLGVKATLSIVKNAISDNTSPRSLLPGIRNIDCEDGTSGDLMKYETFD